MPGCSAFGCTNRTEKGYCLKVFPKDPKRRALWAAKVKRLNWVPTDHSFLCEVHFDADQWKVTGADGKKKLKGDAVPTLFDHIPKHHKRKLRPEQSIIQNKILQVCERNFKDEVLQNSTYFIKITGQIISAPMKWLKLKENAVPSIFPGCLSFMSSSSSLQESQSQKQQTLKSDLGTEFQNVAGTSIVIKQEPEGFVDEPLQLVIEQVFSGKELLSSNSSSSTCNIPPIPENVLPIANPDSTNLDQTPATHVSNKTAQKRKINDAELDANDITPAGSQSELCLRAKPSMPSKINSNLYQHAGILKKSTECSTLPTKNGENATREIFQSLFDGSGSNPLFGSGATERPGDLFDVFADFIADKLREMDSDDCAYALRTILDAVFQAGKVQHDNKDKSDISNPKNSSGSLYKE